MLEQICQRAYLDDTWEFDGQAWREIQLPGVVPSPRTTELVYDAARGVVVLHGGSGMASSLRDTWEYDGASWTQRSTATLPTARRHYVAAYDRRRAKEKGTKFDAARSLRWFDAKDRNQDGRIDPEEMKIKPPANWNQTNS